MNTYQILAKTIQKQKNINRATLVGISGVDGSGKTYLTKKIADELEHIGETVCVVHVDDFHNSQTIRYRKGRDSPEGFYHDSIDFSSLENQCLRPILSQTTEPLEITSKIFDLKKDTPNRLTRKIGLNDIVLVEGIFLFRPKLIEYFDLRVFIDSDFDVTLPRMRSRDLGENCTEAEILEYDRRHSCKYVPGQELYLRSVEPQKFAEIVVDNNDLENPKVSFHKN